MDEAQRGTSPSSNWFVSHVDIDKRIYSSFDRCFITLYDCLFTQLRLMLPFSGFEEESLNRLDVSPSQLHPSTWAFSRVF